MKVKTSELIGPALNWAVVKASGQNAEYWLEKYASVDRRCMCESPSTDWSQGGPIIESGANNLFKHNEGTEWCCACNVQRDGYIAIITADGPTPLIAAMRCFCASRLGDEVKIPEELK